MAEVNPPLFVETNDAYGADELGLPYRDLIGEGIVGAGDLLVAADTGLKTSVAAGAAWVKGDDDANAQPTYRVRNDAAVLLNHAAADPTNPRIDLVIAEVLDAGFVGVSRLWRLRVVTGTPAAAPVAPATPADALALAEVRINAGSGTITSVTDKRSRAKVGAGAALSAAGRVVTKGQQSNVDGAPTGVSGAGTGDNFITLPAATFENLLHYLEFSVYIEDTGGSATLQFYLLDGVDGAQVATWFYRSPATNPGNPIFVRIPFTPSAGAHTFQIKYRDPVGGKTFTVKNSNVPSNARIVVA